MYEVYPELDLENSVFTTLVIDSRWWFI